MSFLAKLREQNRPTDHSLQLCYLFSLSSQNQVSIKLVLGERHAGVLHPGSKNYFLQAQHLLQAPPFFKREDVEILRALNEGGERWVNQCEGLLLERDAPSLEKILLSNRCFVSLDAKAESGGMQRVRLSEEPESQVTLAWRIEGNGEQHIHWRHKNNLRVFSLENFSSGRLYVCDIDNLQLSKVEHDYSEEAMGLIRNADRTLAVDQLTSFYKSKASAWMKFNLPLPEKLPIEQREATLLPVLRFGKAGGDALALGDTAIFDGLYLEYRYCSMHFCFSTESLSENEVLEYWDGSTVNRMLRDKTSEGKFRQVMEKHLSKQTSGFKYSEEHFCWVTNRGGDWRTLLINERDQLSLLGFQFQIDADFTHHFVVPNEWHVSLQGDDNEFQLSIDLELAGSAISLSNLLDQLKEINLDSGEQFSPIRLKDGRLLLLPVEKLIELGEEFGDRFSSGGELTFPLGQLSRVGKLGELLPENTHWQGDENLLEQAINIHKSPVLLDAGLSCVKADLRPYQWLGVCWLQHLYDCKINGLLADDMGLGKTLQTISFLSFQKEQGLMEAPALIVMPTSLLYNWEREIKQFAPQLTVQIMHGSQRHVHWDNLAKANIILSSYQLIANDINRWQECPLSWLILDEAQVIKNPRTQVSQALREMSCANKLCLSGTPMENHLGELWSIYDFLMPNCLGSKQEFRHYFQYPIEREGNTQRLQQLLNRIGPFMLRRTKDQVVKELPKKTISTQIVSLSERQHSFYDQIRDFTWSELEGKLTEGNEGKKQILLLSAILKLRQACCDPRLLNEHEIPSAKTEHCLDMISELVEEKRSILVFSQFTSLLDILADELDKKNITYLMLTGKTRNRQDLVDRFQSGCAPVMLMSLKAGGVGLNLTRADTVIHFDPWWNSAAEQQATDRAHRIGQDKPVFVYKLITEGTIEEKISKLQERKAILSQHINDKAISSAEKFSMSLEELLTLVKGD